MVGYAAEATLVGCTSGVHWWGTLLRQNWWGALMGCTGGVHWWGTLVGFEC